MATTGRPEAFRTETSTGTPVRTGLERRRWLRSSARRSCYSYGMTRERVSTTVDRDLLRVARALKPWSNDASLLDAALFSLVAQHRASQLDDAYKVYDELPLDQADEWGDLASFRASAGSS